MAHSFVLIDAIPGMENAVWESLGKVRQIVVKRRLNPKVGNAEFLVLVEGLDPDAVEKTITGIVRGIGGVHTVQRLSPHHTLASKLLPLMQEMEREAAGGREAKTGI